MKKKKKISELIANDYPKEKKRLRRIFNEFLHPVHLDRSILSTQLPKKITSRPPCYFGISKCFSRQLIKFHVFLSHASRRSLKSLILNYEPVVHPFDLVDFVYKIPFNASCCSSIGQTGQKLGDN